MSVHANITAQLAIAAGRIGAAYPEHGIQIDYFDEDPEQIWRVQAIDGPGGDHAFVVNDETGAIDPPLHAAVPEARAELDGLEVIITRSAGSDGALCVIIDSTGLAPEDEHTDGRPAIRVDVNDGPVYVGREFRS